MAFVTNRGARAQFKKLLAKIVKLGSKLPEGERIERVANDPHPYHIIDRVEAIRSTTSNPEILAICTDIENLEGSRASMNDGYLTRY